MEEHKIGPTNECTACIDDEIDYHERYENLVIICAPGCPECLSRSMDYYEPSPI